MPDVPGAICRKTCEERTPTFEAGAVEIYLACPFILPYHNPS